MILGAQPIGDQVVLEVNVQQVTEECYTAFCYVCHAQVFGDDENEVAEDVTHHMNEVHPRA